MAVNYNFEWDPNKADINKDQHGINFEEGSTVFLDQNALSIFDTGHSETEDRWITMGLSGKGRVLVVCHTYRKESKESVSIRIFSTRKATKQEIKTYGEVI